MFSVTWTLYSKLWQFWCFDPFCTFSSRCSGLLEFGQPQNWPHDPPNPLLQCFSDYNESPLLGAWNIYSSDSMGWTHRQPSLPPQVPLPPARLVGQGGGGERSQRVHGRQLAAGARGDWQGSVQGDRICKSGSPTNMNSRKKLWNLFLGIFLVKRQ